MTETPCANCGTDTGHYQQKYCSSHCKLQGERKNKNVWVVINSKTNGLMFYGTRSEADHYKNEIQPMVSDKLKVRLLKVGMTIYERRQKKEG